MTDRAQGLLAKEDPTLFSHGGCHVFALALKRRFPQYELVRIEDRTGRFEHLACEPAEDVVLDVFGWFTRSEYQQAERAEGRGLTFRRTSEDEIARESIETDGEGLYTHPCFLELAKRRAEAWIQQHSSYFDGTQRRPIPDLVRVQTHSAKEIFG